MRRIVAVHSREKGAKPRIVFDLHTMINDLVTTVQLGISRGGFHALLLGCIVILSVQEWTVAILFTVEVVHQCKDIIGTVLIHAPIRDGAAKGKCERFFGVLKSRWLNGMDIGQIRSIDEFNRELAEAVRKHNLSVNSSTNQTPMDRFLATRGRIPAPQSQVWLDDAFMNRARRKVRNDATLSLLNLQFDAPMQFIRQAVEVRFLPDRLDEAYIFENGARFPLKLTDKQANSRVKREKWPTVDYSKEDSHV